MSPESLSGKSHEHAEFEAPEMGPQTEFNGTIGQFRDQIEDEVTELQGRKSPDELTLAERMLVEAEVEIARLREENAKLREASITDPLTGLKNRRYYEEQLQQWKESQHRMSPEGEQERRESKEDSLTAVLAIDVNYFKEVNDTHGHLVGDEVLRQIAQAVQGVLLRKDDIAMRIGGDEIMVFLNNVKSGDAEKVAERLYEAIASIPMEANGQPVHLGVSIGVKEQAPGERAQEVLSQADLALYAAKEKKGTTDPTIAVATPETIEAQLQKRQSRSETTQETHAEAA